MLLRAIVGVLLSNAGHILIFDSQAPFRANNHSDIFVRLLQDELNFPDDRVLGQDTKSVIRCVSSFDSCTQHRLVLIVI